MDSLRKSKLEGILNAIRWAVFAGYGDSLQYLFVAEEFRRRSMLARTLGRATCRAADKSYANALHLDVRLDVYDSTDLIVVRVDAADCRSREGD